MGGAIAPPILLEMKKKVAFSTPNISRLQEKLPTKVISTPNILHLPTGLRNTNLNENYISNLLEVAYTFIEQVDELSSLPVLI